MESFVEFARFPRRVLKRVLSRVQADIMLFLFAQAQQKGRNIKWDSHVAQFSFVQIFNPVSVHSNRNG